MSTVVFTDGSGGGLQSLYFLVTKYRVDYIVVDEGQVDILVGAQNVHELVYSMGLDIPVYLGSRSQHSPPGEHPIEIYNRKETQYDPVPFNAESIEPIYRAVITGPYTTVASLLLENKVHNLVMFPREIDVSIDEYAYKCVLESDNIKLVYTDADIDTDTFLKVRMIAISSPTLLRLIPKDPALSLEDNINNWGFYTLVLVMKHLDII